MLPKRKMFFLVAGTIAVFVAWNALKSKVGGDCGCGP